MANLEKRYFPLNSKYSHYTFFVGSSTHIIFSLKPETFAFNQAPTLIWIHCKSSSNFDLFNLKFICRHLCRAARRFHPIQEYRRLYILHPVDPKTSRALFLQNTSGAELIPNGSLQYRYRPNGVLNVNNLKLSLSS
jgi:hypothetical protein